MYPVGIVFKGPGFHVNDYASKRNGKDTAKPTQPAETPETKPEPLTPAKADASSPSATK